MSHKVTEVVVTANYLCYADDERGVACCWEGESQFTVLISGGKGIRATTFCPECGEEGSDDGVADYYRQYLED